MLEHPVYVRMPTDRDYPYLKNRSAAETVISTLVSAQMRGWLRLHGFVVLPSALEMVASVLKQGVAGVVAHVQADTIPMLSVLMPEAGYFWSPRYTTLDLTTQLALDAQLQMLLLAPVANNLVKSAGEYPYSSANPRYAASVAPYAGFRPALERLRDIGEDETGVLPATELQRALAQKALEKINGTPTPPANEAAPVVNPAAETSDHK